MIDWLTPVVKKTYGLSHEQAAIVKEYIDEMLGKSFIGLSNLLYTVLILIVKKPERRFQVCVDYCALNALTIKNWNTFLLIWESFACFFSAKNYSKFDIIAVFNEICIWEGDKEKTEFYTRYELYEYVVMLFSLCNASSTF